MLVDKRKGHQRAVYLSKADFEALHGELRALPLSKTPMAMSFAPGAENRARLYIFTDDSGLCFVEAHPDKPNYWHSPSKHLCTRLTDQGVEVLVAPSARRAIGETFLQRILDTVGKPMTPEHFVY